MDNLTRTGMCAEYRQKIKESESKEELVGFYKTIPNWCLENHHPPLDVMKTFNGVDDGFYADCNVDIVADKQTYIFNQCTGRVTTKFNTKDPYFPMLYFGLGCDMEVIVDGFRCTIELYDNSKVNVKEINGGIAKIYNYGTEECNITH